MIFIGSIQHNTDFIRAYTFPTRNIIIIKVKGTRIINAFECDHRRSQFDLDCKRRLKKKKTTDYTDDTTVD